MALQVAALASGSNGNCYYVGNEQDAILVDVGISARELEGRMRVREITPRKIKAIFISHEHSDHICGLQRFAIKYDLPVYITSATIQNSRLKLPAHLQINFQSAQPVIVGDLEITAFSKLHDAADPYSFVIDHDGVRVGVFTDIGTPCQRVIDHFSTCHAAFLEANYDEDMLWKGSYPFYLKRRISSDHGHLSNRQAFELFQTYRPSFMSHLILSHLSKNNNCPKLVQSTFEEGAGGVKMIVASRYESTAVYTVTRPLQRHQPLPLAHGPSQLQLFA